MPLDTAIQQLKTKTDFPNTYPLKSDLFGGNRKVYPLFQQPGPDIWLHFVLEIRQTIILSWTKIN